MKKVGFYGHSIVSWANDHENRSFIDMLREEHNLEIVNIGVPQGSEERILFELKKTKNLDAAIIFHSQPAYMFIPGSNRDVSVKQVPASKAGVLWSENGKLNITPEEFKDEFFGYSNIKDLFGSPEEFRVAMTSMKLYFWHADLFRNRFFSTANMIDLYLLNANIPSFHSIHPQLHPSWLEFKSGPVDYSLTLLASNPVSSGNRFPNNLDESGNGQVFAELNKWLSNAW